MTKSRPLFVAISDVHFNLNTLNTASRALITACHHAERLNVPLVVAGDLNDTKAVVRAEVMNQLISIFKYTGGKKFVLVGNHDLVNEKGEEHSLNFLEPYATIVDMPKVYPEIPEVFFVPYQSKPAVLERILSAPRTEKIFVMHQGFNGAFMGDYIQDKSSITTDLVKHVKVFSGHYHRHQNLGTVTYIGNPFSVSFGEANDGPKGFIVVNSDGSYEQVPLKLRKHVVYKVDVTNDNFLLPVNDTNEEDYIWVKVTGPRSKLANITKKEIANYIGHENFKLDKIPSDGVQQVKKVKMKDDEVLDSIIDETTDSPEYKASLKKLWRELYENSAS